MKYPSNMNHDHPSPGGFFVGGQDKMESKEKVVVKIVTDTSELDEACAKAERLTFTRG